MPVYMHVPHAYFLTGCVWSILNMVCIYMVMSYQQYSPFIISTVNDTMYLHHILLYLCASLNETTDLGAGYECDWNATATPTMKACISVQVIAGWAVGGEVKINDAILYFAGEEEL